MSAILKIETAWRNPPCCPFSGVRVLKKEELPAKVQELGGVLTVLVEDSGFQPPLYFALIAANGYAMFGAFDPRAAEVFRCIGEHDSATGDVALPVNVFIVDSRGEEAARVMFDESGLRTKPYLN